MDESSLRNLLLKSSVSATDRVMVSIDETRVRLSSFDRPNPHLKSSWTTWEKDQNSSVVDESSLRNFCSIVPYQLQTDGWCQCTKCKPDRALSIPSSSDPKAHGPPEKMTRTCLFNFLFSSSCDEDLLNDKNNTEWPLCCYLALWFPCATLLVKQKTKRISSCRSRCET